MKCCSVALAALHVVVVNANVVVHLVVSVVVQVFAAAFVVASAPSQLGSVLTEPCPIPDVLSK